MKFAIVVLVAVLAVAIQARPEEEKYTDKYDSINVKEILENDKLFKSYFNCLLGEGPCNAEGKELKSHMTDGLETGCSKCTEVQKKTVYEVIDYTIEHKPDYWKKLTEKYDPQGIYKKKYEDQAAAKGIKLPQ